ncbi:hypothetical protein [Burkholderia cepacia]|uniref:hypothetical protein n=1 Tax=Burkholderia cepacia TaxID=292 RepID=UPI0012BC233A|nr:hypothetical protein [Burkholderia cepacia]
MATAATVTASIVTTATGTDRRWRGTVRDSRTGAPTASASRRELQPGALPGRFAGQTGDSPPASSAAAMCLIDGPVILLPPFFRFSTISSAVSECVRTGLAESHLLFLRHVGSFHADLIVSRNPAAAIRCRARSNRLRLA